MSGCTFLNGNPAVEDGLQHMDDEDLAIPRRLPETTQRSSRKQRYCKGLFTHGQSSREAKPQTPLER